jgi:hypothetical protein
MEEKYKVAELTAYSDYPISSALFSNLEDIQLIIALKS